MGRARLTEPACRFRQKGPPISALNHELLQRGIYAYETHEMDRQCCAAR